MHASSIQAARRFLSALMLCLPLILIVLPGCTAQKTAHKTPQAPAEPLSAACHQAASKPQARWIALAPSLVEIVFALNAQKQLIAVGRFSNHPPQARSLPKVGAFMHVDAEAIVRLKPDGILAIAHPGNAAALDTLETLGVCVARFSGERLEDLWQTIEGVGQLMHASQAAHKLLATSRAALRHALALGPKPKVKLAVVVGHRPLVLAGAQSFLGTVLLQQGFVPVPKTSLPFPQLGFEALRLSAPDAVLDLTGHSTENIANFWIRSQKLLGTNIPIWASVPDAWVRPGPRLPFALQHFAKIWQTPPPPRTIQTHAGALPLHWIDTHKETPPL